MGTISTSVEQLIGGTPLLELRQIQRAEGLNATLLAKLEYLNPAGSDKYRVAKAMLDDGEAKGLLTPGTVIIEPTSGNTGIALAALAAALAAFHSSQRTASSASFIHWTTWKGSMTHLALGQRRGSCRRQRGPSPSRARS